MAPAASVGKRNLVLNAAANWTGYVAQLAVAFFLCPIFVHRLGDDRYGIWSLVESILAYLTLLDMGVAASLVRYTSRFEATGDRENLNRVFSTSLLIFAAAGLLAFLVVFGLAAAGIGLLHVPPPLRAETTWTLVLLGVNLAIGLPLGVFPSMLDGLGRYPTRTAIRTAGLLARVPLSLAVLGGDGGMLRLAWVVTITTVLEHVALAVALHLYLPHLRFRVRLIDRAGLRTIWGYSVHAFVAMLAGRISFQTDALVIGSFLAPQYITFFVIAARLTENAKNCLRAVTAVLTPAVSTWEARRDDGAIRRVLLDGTRWVLWVILPIQAGLIVLGRPFLALWMGPEYVGLSFPTLVILAVPLGLTMSQSISGRILYGIGRLRWFARAVLAEAVANLLLSVALARPLGIEGVALGTAVPNAIANVAIALYICRTLDVRPGVYLRRSFLAPALAAAGLAMFWLIAVAWAAPATWAALVMTGSAGLAVYLPAAVLLEFGPAAVTARLRAAAGWLASGLFSQPVGGNAVTSSEGSR